MRQIYLDYNATTPVLPEVWEAMRPFSAETFGNPASAHTVGRQARKALEDAREQIAELLGAFPDEVIFTSGATEANNLAIFGLAGDPPGHIVASPIEHPCVSEPLKVLAERGFEVEYLTVGVDGRVEWDGVPGWMRPDTRLVTMMRVNHETGAVQESRTLGTEYPVPSTHTDAAQAVSKIPVDFHALGVTALTLSAHKFYGPKGIGALLLKRGAKLRPMLHGGHQQQAKRPGTEPVGLVVGMAKALEIAVRDMDRNYENVNRLHERFLTKLERDAMPVVVNSPRLHLAGVPHTLNMSFPGCRADALLIALDLAGVACSTGSACSSGSLLPSPVLRAMGVPEDVLRSAMRFSFSHLTTEVEIDEAAGRVVKAVLRMRECQDDEML